MLQNDWTSCSCNNEQIVMITLENITIDVKIKI